MSLTDEDKRWIRGELERVETTLLTEFHKWASPLEARCAHACGGSPRPGSRNGAIDERVKKLKEKP